MSRGSGADSTHKGALVNDKPPIPQSYFEAISEVANEYLGTDHSCSQKLSSARKSPNPQSMEEAMELVHALPPMQRDHILLTAKTRLREEQEVLNFLTNRGKNPVKIPPNRTLN
jgi:hypothetical protein